MKEYISFDSHKRYTLAERENVRTGKARQSRIEHRPGAILEYLNGCQPNQVVAVEAIGNWYWIVDEIEQAGAQPVLVHPRKAKLMMGMTNKTDKLDVHGLNHLQRNKTLPKVWIASRQTRDHRQLTRIRMVISRRRTQIKNLLSSIFAKYGLELEEFSDRYAKKARSAMEAQIKVLPEQTAWAAQMLLEELDRVEESIGEQEKRVKELILKTKEMELLKSIPGIGVILSAVIALEIGDVQRFACAEKLASYAGTTPRVHSSGGKVRMGQLRTDVNHCLKWAYAEAANCICINHKKFPDRHVSRLYQRIRQRKGHAKAVGAVSRHLAEASFYVLTRREPYKDPALGNLGRCKREDVMSP
jgi:transposase